MTGPVDPRAMLPHLHALVSEAAYTTAPRHLPLTVLAHTCGKDWMHVADAIADAVVAELLAGRDPGGVRKAAPVDRGSAR